MNWLFFILLIVVVWCSCVIRSQYEPYGVNVAFRKPANQSTTYRDEGGFMYTAPLGVDGRISTTFSSKTCSHTIPEQTYSSWTVDLQGSHFIKFIRIYQAIVIVCSNYSIANGSMTVVQYGDSNQTFTYGTKLNVRCHEGYKMSDYGVVANETESSLECIDTGNWSRILSCTVTDCGWPPNITNNSKQTLIPGIAGNTTYNATLAVECNEGYHYSLQDKGSLRCANDGLWAGKLGNCNVIDCGRPLNIPGNSTVMFSTGLAGNTSYNATLTVRCNKGFNYTLPGNETIRCGNEGRWPDILGLCKAIECFIIFSIENGEIKVKATGVDGKNNTYGVKLSVECDSGFTSNVIEITCLESGLSSEPACSADYKPTNLLATVVGSVVSFITVVSLGVGIVIFMRRQKKHKDDSTRNSDQIVESKVGGSSNPDKMDFNKDPTDMSCKT